ncbi:formyltetrahydrofolate deformylase [Novosphingobium sp. LASN5T]|uniref:formyltetrahydrofolate deformylase n=1 Tax=Novosphingobium sp. LASN5T TaxID=2491021 RepID=UPI000F5FE5BD|nr:formyltetrahydrofolate deformylase [Novosphingobium sp. LASN5T]RQW46112.1 formyltetrahydrofolate deformylase [Novosphingobium sp. LASN5T]
MDHRYILTLDGTDVPGIVSHVSSFFFERGYNIEESAQFRDPFSDRFFLRTVFCGPAVSDPVALTGELRAIVPASDLNCAITDADRPMKIMLAVSKWGHCLTHVLAAWKRGALNCDIVGVVSNHQDMAGQVAWYGLPYHYLPVTPETKREQETQIIELMEESGAKLLVLARYMQVLSTEMCEELSGRAINIHHSFLPGFKGAKPYERAYERGVKLIGATAHYVTSDLDEGPIIEQAVERVTHALLPNQLIETGRDIESSVLTRAVRWHCEHRVLRNGGRTIVFP